MFWCAAIRNDPAGTRPEKPYRGAVPQYRHLIEKATGWLEPEANPSGVIYGVLAMGTLLAAEGARGETYAAVMGASVLALVLYWLAHAYARHFASRLEQPEQPGLRWIGPAVLHEAAMLKGAAMPIVAMLLSWVLRAPLSAAVTAALWTAGVELLVLELLAGLRRHLGILDIAVEVALGGILGAGVLGIRVLLH